MSLPVRGRIHHVASVVRDIDASIDFHTRVLGLALEQVADVPSQEVRIAFLTAGDSKIELVSPTNETSGVARFLESKGEGFHHLCLEVPDIAAELTALAETLCPPGRRRAHCAGYDALAAALVVRRLAPPAARLAELLALGSARGSEGAQGELPL